MTTDTDALKTPPGAADAAEDRFLAAARRVLLASDPDEQDRVTAQACLAGIGMAPDRVKALVHLAARQARRAEARQGVAQ